MRQESILNGAEPEQPSSDSLAIINDLAQRLVGNTKGDPAFIEAMLQAWRDGRYDEPIPYGQFVENGQPITKSKSARELLQEASVAFSTLAVNNIGGEIKARSHQQRVDSYHTLLNKIENTTPKSI